MTQQRTSGDGNHRISASGQLPKTQGARQGNACLDSRPVAGGRCLALLLAYIVPDSQALEQPTQAPTTQTLKTFSVRAARGSHRLACAPNIFGNSAPSNYFVSSAVCAVGVRVS